MSKYTKVIPDDIQKAIGWLLPEVKEGKRFLDVGCSTGYFGEYIKTNLDNEVDGVEISEDKIEAKKKLGNVYSFNLDEPWPDRILRNSYDYILFGDVLEHLKNPLLSLQAAKKALREDGLVFVSVPNIAHISTRLELMNGSFQYEETGILDNTHLQYFTKDTFCLLAHKAGFAVVSTDYSLNDFPNRIVTQLLEKVGLKPTPRFKDVLDSVEARAYQYKFVLKPIDKPNAETGLSKPLPPKPEHFRDEFISNLEARIVEIKAHADKQAEIIESQKQEILRLQSKMPRIGRKVGRLLKSLFNGRN